MFLCDEVVNSSTITAIAYDSDVSQLYVRFKTHKTYRYENVPQTVYDRLATADSKGKYFSRQIRGAFQSAELDQTEARRLAERIGERSAAVLDWRTTLQGSQVVQDRHGLFF